MKQAPPIPMFRKRSFTAGSIQNPPKLRKHRWQIWRVKEIIYINQNEIDEWNEKNT